MWSLVRLLYSFGGVWCSKVWHGAVRLVRLRLLYLFGSFRCSTVWLCKWTLFFRKLLGDKYGYEYFESQELISKFIFLKQEGGKVS